MAEFDKKYYKLKKGKDLSSVDQALLDEFFSAIARVAIRLTKTDVQDKNANNRTKQEVSKL